MPGERGKCPSSESFGSENAKPGKCGMQQQQQGKQTNKQTMAKKSDGNCCGKFSSTRESRFMEQIDDESERIESNWDRGK